MASLDDNITNFTLLKDRVAWESGSPVVAANQFPIARDHQIVGMLQALKSNISTTKTGGQNLRATDTPTFSSVKLTNTGTNTEDLILYLDIATGKVKFYTKEDFLTWLGVGGDAREKTVLTCTGGVKVEYNIVQTFSSVDEYEVVFRAYESDASDWETFVNIKIKREVGKVSVIADDDCTVFLEIVKIN